MSFQNKKAKGCVKRERPGWWTPEGVLQRLQAGVIILEICKQAAEEAQAIGVTISPVTLRGEVQRWCESATWGEQLRAGLALWKRSSSGELVLSKAWHDDFFAAMETCKGNAQQAAELAGIGYGIVLAVQDSRNACYDRDFVERFRIAEAQRIGVLREKYMQTAEGDEGKLAMRAQERLIESSLPGMHGQRQEVHVSGKVAHEHGHDHRHLHAMAPEMAREVALASQQRVRRITSGRQDAEDEGGVIDVTPHPKAAADRIELRNRVEGVLGTRGVAALEGAIEEAMDKAMPIIRDSMDATMEKPS